ncbi:hypothetical protein [Pseudanabaena sp. FACHB-1998]|uniref:hypothetical protein n=1 Tax=Pseudanabaena sp. FACHB-1998 TaxID=2692858 RepID=UPI0018EFF777|nr:hypothetical protein [Pseudanabaena sp. FACHB-1998]
MLMFMMNTDSHLFFNRPSDDLLPLYEGKMFFVYDHRYGFYTDEMLNSDQVDFKIIPTPNIENLQDPSFKVNPRYWISNNEVKNRLSNCNWKKDWLVVFRGITSSVNERTTIFSLLPKVGVGHSAPLIILEQSNVTLISCLLANFSSLLFDFIARQKLGGNNFSLFILKQLPVLPPDRYSQNDINYITPRVLELTYTAWDIKPFADDLWNPLTPQPPLPLGEGEKENFLHPSPSGRGAGGEGASILTQASDKQQLKFDLAIEITGKQQLELTTPPDPTDQTHLRQLILEQWQANRAAFEQDALTPQPPLPRGEGEQEDFLHPSPSGRGAGGEGLGIPLPPFIWHETRRAQIRAELDAYYAKLYGLTRDELRYILDPADIYGADFPSETFRVLKNNEMKKYGEYRTQRLVLEAWDKLGY